MTYGISYHALSFQLLLSYQVNFIVVRTIFLIDMFFFSFFLICLGTIIVFKIETKEYAIA